MDSSSEKHIGTIEIEESLARSSNAKVEESTPLPDLCIGVKFSYFNEFIRSKGGKSIFQDLTTGDVVEKFIKPKCEQNHKSFCEKLQQENSSSVGFPTWFVSHAWNYKFLDTVESIRLTLERVHGEEKAMEAVVWFDLFSLNHSKAKLIDDNIFKHWENIIKNISNMMFILMPWNEPVTLTRSFTVYELFLCVKYGLRLELAMTLEQREDMIRSILQDYRQYNKILAKVDSSFSLTASKIDKDIIDSIISRDIGFASVDRRAFISLGNWIINLLSDRERISSDLKIKSDYLFSIASMYQLIGSVKDAERCFKDCLELRRKCFGIDARETRDVVDSLVGVYESQDKHKEAIDLYYGDYKPHYQVLKRLVTRPKLEYKVAASSSDNASSSAMGVKFSFFEQFIAENGGVDNFRGKSTRKVNEEIIIPFNNDHKSRVCQSLRIMESDYFGKPNWFISHAWDGLFLDLVEAVGLTLQRTEGESYRDTYVWFDQFSLAHPCPPSLPYKELHDTFMNSTREIGKMVMIFDRWHDPYHLKRAWCVFEAYACVHTRSMMEVAMTEAENDRFLKATCRSDDTFYHMLNKIDTEKSEGDTDKKSIHEAIRTEVGFRDLNKKIFTALENWMISLLQSKIESEKDKLEERAAWQHACANIYEKSGRNTLALPLLGSAFHIRRAILGKDHPDTLRSAHTLARLHQSCGDFDEAARLYTECLKGRTRVLGCEHPDTKKTQKCITGLADLLDQHVTLAKNIRDNVTSLSTSKINV